MVPRRQVVGDQGAVALLGGALRQGRRPRGGGLGQIDGAGCQLLLGEPRDLGRAPGAVVGVERVVDVLRAVLPVVHEGVHRRPDVVERDELLGAEAGPQRLEQVEERVAVGLRRLVDAVLGPLVVEVDPVEPVCLHHGLQLGCEGVRLGVGGEVGDAGPLVIAQHRQQHLGAAGLQRPDLVPLILQRRLDALVEVQARAGSVPVDVRGEDDRDIERGPVGAGQHVVGDIAQVIAVDLDVDDRGRSARRVRGGLGARRHRVRGGHERGRGERDGGECGAHTAQNTGRFEHCFPLLTSDNVMSTPCGATAPL